MLTMEGNLALIGCHLPVPHLYMKEKIYSCNVYWLKKKKNPCFHDSVSSSGYHSKLIWLLNLIKVQILSGFISTKWLNFCFVYVLKAGLDVTGVFTKHGYCSMPLHFPAHAILMEIYWTVLARINTFLQEWKASCTLSSTALLSCEQRNQVIWH